MMLYFKVSKGFAIDFFQRMRSITFQKKKKKKKPWERFCQTKAGVRHNSRGWRPVKMNDLDLKMIWRMTSNTLGTSLKCTFFFSRRFEGKELGILKSNSSITIPDEIFRSQNLKRILKAQSFRIPVLCVKSLTSYNSKQTLKSRNRVFTLWSRKCCKRN